MHFLFYLYRKKNVISPFSPLKWETAWRRETTSEEASKEKSEKGRFTNWDQKYCNLSFPISAAFLALSFEVLSEALNQG